jgi:outer membrane lipoprotein LolB
MGARCGFLAVMLLGLAGCADLSEYRGLVLPTEAPPATAWEKHRASVASIKEWTLQGRIAVETDKDSLNAGLYWVQNGDAYSLRVMAPLSQGTFELKGNPGQVELTDPRNRTVRARDPEALMQQQLGWSLPLAGMRDWIKGIPGPGVPAKDVRYDEMGRVTDMRQDGWRISVLRYKTVGDKDLPDKLFMQNGSVKIRMVVGEWKLR